MDKQSEKLWLDSEGFSDSLVHRIHFNVFKHLEQLYHLIWRISSSIFHKNGIWFDLTKRMKATCDYGPHFSVVTAFDNYFPYNTRFLLRMT